MSSSRPVALVTGASSGFGEVFSRKLAARGYDLILDKITLADFEGWIQERGLYFANTWDERYQTPLETHDKGDKDQPGALLYARYGKGAYIFTAFSWFRELPAGVPGAYRIFANLISAGKAGAGK